MKKRMSITADRAGVFLIPCESHCLRAANSTQAILRSPRRLAEAARNAMRKGRRPERRHSRSEKQGSRRRLSAEPAIVNQASCGSISRRQIRGPHVWCAEADPTERRGQELRVGNRRNGERREIQPPASRCPADDLRSDQRRCRSFSLRTEADPMKITPLGFGRWSARWTATCPCIDQDRNPTNRPPDIR